MKSKHTKGKWQIENDHTGMWVGNGEQEVATIEKQIKSSEREANAKLIAAAPELLEACKAMKEWIDWKCKDEADIDMNLDNIDSLIKRVLK